MRLTEEEFTRIVDAGCGECTRAKVVILAVVVQKLPLLQGEIYGSPSWGYKGEDLVRGTYRITCEGCKKALFESDACPRCDRVGGLAPALDGENDFPLLARCTPCGSELMVAQAYVPARAVYEGKRAAKAHCEAAPEDPGFHAFRVECTRCHDVTVRAGGCAVCGA